MSWANSDGRNLERIADALERSAAAEERRNELIERDAVERREAWAESERRNQAAIDRLTGPMVDDPT